ncbi:MAG: hypothetical protein JXM70_10070 [Pirellulales bacterium]|nr:hypothetical protein [Pirellulales bacterium]
MSSQIIPLDGEGWLLSVDPKNVGQKEGWFNAPRPDAKPTKVPWIIQDVFPGYHGVAWYWRNFAVGKNPHAGGRVLLRFWAVDYKADVWLNGQRVGGHEGGETPFVIDVTDAVKTGGAKNTLAVRVLNPTDQLIDGIKLDQTPHRNKTNNYFAGASWNHGGIVDSVEVMIVPALRVEDLFVRPDPKTGKIRVQANVRNAGKSTIEAEVSVSAASAASGQTAVAKVMTKKFPPGDTLVETEVEIKNHRLWQLNDPFLYRVSLGVRAAGSRSTDTASTRCGFREFRFANGYFRLNGKRLYLRCSQTGNHAPIGMQLAHDPELFRRDLILAKAMGFNAIRFIAGLATRYQLDMCDEIGLLVYAESYAAWCMQNSPKLVERYDQSQLEMILRDRNHPSIVIWGLLNETGKHDPLFKYAVGFLPKLHKLDDTRMVMLASGRWDLRDDVNAPEALRIFKHSADVDAPCVTFNAGKQPINHLGITWAPGQLALHPGPKDEKTTVRWTATDDGQIEIDAEFSSIAEKATTDVHVLHNGRAVFDGGINVNGAGPKAAYKGELKVKRGDAIDFMLGYGNGNYGADTTALAAKIKTSDGKTYDAAANFKFTSNPNGAWSYGELLPGQAAGPGVVKLFKPQGPSEAIGSLCNPGSKGWENVLDDQHPYPRAPHTSDIVNMLRGMGSDQRPMFISEYGIGSPVDLMRVVRHYERLGKGGSEDGLFYRGLRDQFLRDWKLWKMDDAFDRPEDYFADCIAKMAGQRTVGLNAIRSNPKVVAHSITGTVDQGMTGEGLWTTFRELKPGTMEAVSDAFAPLRFCLFAEPRNVYRGTPVRLEAVLANEDALLPGKYPIRIEVVGPRQTRIFQKNITLTIPDPKGKPEPPMVLPLFDEEVIIDGPAGKYRLLATFESGASAKGGETVFHVADRAEYPKLQCEVVLFGEDPAVEKWLAAQGIRTRKFSADKHDAREVILVTQAPPAADASKAFAALARHIARGSTAIFLSPHVFNGPKGPMTWLPMANKGRVDRISSWLYLKDDWAKRHPIFDGLPAGGLMDWEFYREVIPDNVYIGQNPAGEAVAGAMKTSQNYHAGLTVAVHHLGAGRFVLNTMFIPQNLGKHPAADRMLLNMLQYGEADAEKPLAPLPGDFEKTLKSFGY